MREGSWKQSNENRHPISDTLYGNQPHGLHPRYDTGTEKMTIDNARKCENGKCGTVKNAGVENAGVSSMESYLAIKCANGVLMLCQPDKIVFSIEHRNY